MAQEGKMKAIFIITMCLWMAGFTARGQFRGAEPQPPSVRESVVQQGGESFLSSIFNLDRLEMRHSFSMGYQSYGSFGLGYMEYTNSMRYRLFEPLTIRADVSVVTSPFSSLGSKFSQDFSGIYLKRASIDYAPSKDFKISLQYRGLPPGTGYNPYYNRYGYNGVGWGLDDDSWEKKE